MYLWLCVNTLYSRCNMFLEIVVQFLAPFSIFLLFRRRHFDRLPPDREHHRIGSFRKRQNHQAMEKRLLSPFFESFGSLDFFYFFIFFLCFLVRKEDFYSNRELLCDAEGFQVMKLSKEKPNETHEPRTVYQPKPEAPSHILHVWMLTLPPQGSWRLLSYYTQC